MEPGGDSLASGWGHLRLPGCGRAATCRETIMCVCLWCARWDLGVRVWTEDTRASEHIKNAFSLRIKVSYVYIIRSDLFSWR